MIFYFSGCGNSRFVAETISQTLNEKLLFIPDEMKKSSVYELDSEESVGFVFPVYSWAPPKFVSRFIRQLQFNHKPQYIFAVCTYGDESGRTYEIFQKSLSEIGLHLDSFFGVQMPETYINLPGFKLDTIENEKKKIEAAGKRIPEICEKLVKHQRGVCEMTVGSLPWLKSHVIKALFYATLISDHSFRVENSCNGCGICAKSCPVGNIKINSKKPEWQHHCVGCMSCYHHCPQNAIQFGNATIGKGQYYYGRNEKNY